MWKVIKLHLNEKEYLFMLIWNYSVGDISLTPWTQSLSKTLGCIIPHYLGVLWGSSCFSVGHWALWSCFTWHLIYPNPFLWLSMQITYKMLQVYLVYTLPEGAN